MADALLVLDLDETLVWSRRGGSEHFDFEAVGYVVTRRPHLMEFIDHVSDRWRLGVWTASSADYAEVVMRELFGDDSVFEFVWDVSRCTPRYDLEQQIYYPVKDLKKLKRRGYSLERVLMIDDTAQKLERNYGNHLEVRPFEGDPDDSELADVLPFLDWLVDEPDLRSIEKRHWRSWSPPSP